MLARPLTANSSANHPVLHTTAFLSRREGSRRDGIRRDDWKLIDGTGSGGFSPSPRVTSLDPPAQL